MARVRLTQRTAADDKTPYPGNVNQPDRKDPTSDEYDNFEHTVNHELPDMRTDWRKEKRDEIGFGIPTYASIRQAASQAVKLAVLVLGEKVSEDIIEAQAKDFLRMGSKSLTKTLERYASSEHLYAEEAPAEETKEEAPAPAPVVEEKKDDKKAKDEVPEALKVEKKDEQPVKAAETKVEEAPVPPADNSKMKDAEQPKEEKVEEKKEIPEFIQKKIDESKDEKKEARKAELDIELRAAEEEVDEADEKTASLLKSLFADDSEEEVVDEDKEPVKEAAKRAGAQTLGGQPKMASASADANLDGIWKDAPDVSKAFN